MHADIVVMSKI